MKFIRVLLIILSIAWIGGCGGSDSIKPSVDDDTRTITTAKIASDGTLSYTGTGSFEGFSLTASIPTLAGTTVYIEKTDSAYVKDGYTALSPVFSVRFTDAASSSAPSAVYDAVITIPYTLSGTATDANTVFLAIINNSAVIQSSSKPAAGIIRSATDIPFSFFAGYLNEAETPATKKFIKLLSKSYREAFADSEYFTDPSNIQIPDVIRGTEHVQPGEKTSLDIDTAAFGEPVLNVQWTVKRADGSSFTPLVSGNQAVFIPDTFGNYTVSATVTGSTKTASESLTIKVFGYSYDKNNNRTYCLLFCHSGSVTAPDHKDMYGREIMRNLQTAWSASGHAGAYNTAVTNANSTECATCHGTGLFLADRNSNGTDDYPAVYGFDDTMTVNTDASSASAHLKGVTCEACHGPTATFTGGLSGTISFTGHPSTISISSGVCLTCHDTGKSGGHFAEFHDSGGESTHENSHTVSNSIVVTNEACFKCHSGEGALGMIFGTEITRADTDRISGITCNVCHDPHGEGGHNAQLRVSGSHTLTLYSGNVTVDAGDGKICYTCHNTDGAGIGAVPHNSQAEMFEGKGGWTYGETISLTAAHKALLDCADCHMNRDAGTTHSMAMSENRSDRLAYCNDSCHTGVTADADGRYDYLGKTADVRTLMDTLKARINTLAGRAAESEISASYSVTGNTALTSALNRAAYNYNFIISDKSFGLHNYRYAARLLELSINDLTSF
ncbi:hypothetical protein EP073_03885 [Geovibrio thiophilus]|uniref:Uncharacterized protein n=1 Tax=Geovibrio thiophilus TaxID=139438 RepID=A0A410JX22_9BACT|nr:cytochrome c3 family protein [Geovibrio thiophilus]QAR32575.1 hypothetical protein EP073_03885 [Geovibrio thiophilus]